MSSNMNKPIPNKRKKMKRKKKWCPAKGENHEEFYRKHPEHILPESEWKKFFAKEKENSSN